MAVFEANCANGVKVLVEPVTNVGSASIGVWCTTGSIDEHPHEAGLTHFIEHMLFKGTARRTAKEIAETIEGQGGHLNAFTDKENTCYYCRVLADFAQESLDVLTDMVTGSLIDPEELEREKGVVTEEINRGEDEPGDHVHEIAISGFWPKHVLGLPVIGTRESVNSFSSTHIKDYMARRYAGDTLVVSVAGNVDPNQVFEWAQESLGGIQPAAEKVEHGAAVPEPGLNLVSKDVEQVHFCITAKGPLLRTDDIYAYSVLDAILGTGMSSRLFQEVRERRGLAYSIGSYNLAYSNGGALNIYGGTGTKTWPEVQEVVRKELDDLIAKGPTEEETEKAKRLLKGSLALSLEAMSSRMMRMARNHIVFGRQVPLEETMAKIDAVTRSMVQETATNCLSAGQLRTTAIGPF